MQSFDYITAINQLGLGRKPPLNQKLETGKVPQWCNTIGFVVGFLPYVRIVGDSREQDHWIEKACEYYGIAFEWARHDDKTGAENLKEGDYTFHVVFPYKTYDYTGRVAYERKGSVGELYSNIIGDRTRINNEFNRFSEKNYQKVVLMLEFGETLTDLIDEEFSYPDKNGKWIHKKVGKTLYSWAMSWKQPNNKNFEIIQSPSHLRLFWLMLQDMYYFFRNELQNECIVKNLIKEVTNNVKGSKKY